MIFIEEVPCLRQAGPNSSTLPPVLLLPWAEPNKNKELTTSPYKTQAGKKKTAPFVASFSFLLDSF